MSKTDFSPLIVTVVRERFARDIILVAYIGNAASPYSAVLSAVAESLTTPESLAEWHALNEKWRADTETKVHAKCDRIAKFANARNN